MTTKRRFHPYLLAWIPVAALVLFGATSNGGIAMDILVSIMSVIGAVAGGEVLPLEPDWWGMAARVVALAIAVFASVLLIRHGRASAGLCPRCGRGDHPRRPLATLGADRLHRLARFVAIGTMLPAGGYAALKLHWAFGGHVGLDDPTVFADVEPWSPGFADTAILAAIGVGLAVLMAWGRPRLPRWLLLAPALIGCAMLVPVSIMGTILNITTLWTDAPFSGLSWWIGWFVYSCFLLWAVGLTFVLVEYHYRTRPSCRACGRSGYVRITA